MPILLINKEDERVIKEFDPENPPVGFVASSHHVLRWVTNINISCQKKETVRQLCEEIEDRFPSKGETVVAAMFTDNPKCKDQLDPGRRLDSAILTFVVQGKSGHEVDVMRWRVMCYIEQYKWMLG